VNSAPRVSVVITTYNHARFIRQTLDSVLGQKTSFAVEVAVIDDFSTDGTRDILLEYQREHASRLRLIFTPSNENHSGRIADEFDRARCDYVCILDGDDYWTSDQKLQKQVDFLDARPDCAMVFHNAVVFDESGNDPPWNITPPGTPETMPLDAIWGVGFIASCTVMVRRNICEKLPQWYIDAEVGDWALNILAGLRGDIGYIDEVMGVYRRHHGGAWSSRHGIDQRAVRIRFYRQVDSALGGAHHAAIEAVLEHAFHDLAERYREYVSRSDWRSAAKAAFAILRYDRTRLFRSACSVVVPEARPRAYARYPSLKRHADALVAAALRHTPAQVEGHHDSATSEEIAGWAIDRSNPRKRLRVLILCDGVVVDETLADRFRADLLDAGIGDGYHAFRCATPLAFLDGRPHTVSTMVVGSAAPLPGREFRIECAPRP
jgi:glycosyltransferase involved in cell wall biosynthesis